MTVARPRGAVVLDVLDRTQTASSRRAGASERRQDTATTLKRRAALLAVGFLSGLVTAISPCVLPVLPILLAGGGAGGRRRPVAIVAGVVATFSLSTLFSAWLLDQLGLPQDLLRDLAIVMLLLFAATLVSRRLAVLVERPFFLITRRPANDLGGGFLLGMSVGLVFVPCAATAVLRRASRRDAVAPAAPCGFEASRSACRRRPARRRPYPPDVVLGSLR